MKDKKIIVFMIIIIITIVGAITLSFFLKKKEMVEENQKTPENPIDEIIDLNVSGIYLCKSVLQENSDYVITAIEEIHVDEGKVLQSIQYVEAKYLNKESYLNVKKINIDSNVLFNDVDNIVINNKKEVDYTKNENLEEVNLRYADYKHALEAINYKCES